MLVKAAFTRSQHAIVIRNGRVEIHRMIAKYRHHVPTTWTEPLGTLVGVYNRDANPHDVALDIVTAAAGEYATK